MTSNRVPMEHPMGHCSNGAVFSGVSFGQSFKSGNQRHNAVDDSCLAGCERVRVPTRFRFETVRFYQGQKALIVALMHCRWMSVHVNAGVGIRALREPHCLVLWRSLMLEAVGNGRRFNELVGDSNERSVSTRHNKSQGRPCVAPLLFSAMERFCRLQPADCRSRVSKRV